MGTFVGATQSDTKTGTVSSGSAITGAIDLEAGRLAKINMPSAWTGSTLSFQTSEDNLTFRDLYDAFGNEITYSVSSNRSVIVEPKDWIASRFVKVRSGTSAASVTQAGDRIVELISFR